MSDWVLDNHGCWNLVRGRVHVWLEQRPPYCDRGHWIGKIDGLSSIDHADCFPRYYMDFERAKAELGDWLDWRLRSERSQST